MHTFDVNKPARRQFKLSHGVRPKGRAKAGHSTAIRTRLGIPTSGYTCICSQNYLEYLRLVQGSHGDFE
eukprot:1773832-Rhodomonas_salina.1